MTTVLSKIYRRKLAKAATNGCYIPRIKFVGFGAGEKPWNPDDMGADEEIIRKEVISVKQNDLTVEIISSISGQEIGDKTIREICYYDEDGDLVAREVVKPKSFEPKTTMKNIAELII